MKVAVIGAGSTYTPELVSGLSDLPVDVLALHDIDGERLDVVGTLAGRMLRRVGFGGKLDLTTDLDRAVDGAAFVLIQIRVGGQAARLTDETLPLACGCIGQETTGAGGFAKALRTVPVVLEIAERVADRAEDGAWIVDFTNPVGIVTRSLLDAGHRAVGLCNVAIGFQRKLASMLDVEPERVTIDHVGLNHLTWVRAAYLDGRDVLPELLDARLEELASFANHPASLVEVLGRQLGGETPRAEVVARIERELLEMYRDPQLDEKPALLEQRGGAFYSEAAVGLVAALSGVREGVHVVDTRNGDTVPGLQQDDVVELPAQVGPAGPAPLPQKPLAPELLGLTQHVAAYERLAAAAAVSRDAGTARKALLAHPLIGQLEMVDGLAETMLAEAVS